MQHALRVRPEDRSVQNILGVGTHQNESALNALCISDHLFNHRPHPSFAYNLVEVARRQHCFQALQRSTQSSLLLLLKMKVVGESTQIVQSETGFNME